MVETELDEEESKQAMTDQEPEEAQQKPTVSENAENIVANDDPTLQETAQQEVVV